MSFDQAIPRSTGYGNFAFTLPHSIAKLTPEQIAIAGPQPKKYSQKQVYMHKNPGVLRGRIWLKDAGRSLINAVNRRRTVNQDDNV